MLHVDDVCCRDVSYPTSAASKVRPVGSNNNKSDRSETKGTGILSDT